MIPFTYGLEYTITAVYCIRYMTVCAYPPCAALQLRLVFVTVHCACLLGLQAAERSYMFVPVSFSV